MYYQQAAGSGIRTRTSAARQPHGQCTLGGITSAYYVEFQWNSPLSYQDRLVQARIFFRRDLHQCSYCLSSNQQFVVCALQFLAKTVQTHSGVCVPRVAYITRQQSLSHVALCLGLRYVTLVITLYIHNQNSCVKL